MKSTNRMFYEEIRKRFANEHEIDINQIYALYPDINRKTISWRVYDLCQQEKMYKVGHGLYSLEAMALHESAGYDYIQKKAKSVYDIMIQYGFEFYVSGIDALIGELLHLPEQYPVLLAVEKKGIREAEEILNKNGFFAILSKDKNILNRSIIREKVDVIILVFNNRNLAKDNIALKEKAFVDLYYMVTRLNYGVSIQELYRIYENMARNKVVSKLKLKESASEYKIVDEIIWLTEVGGLPNQAKEFMQRVLQEYI